MPGVDPAEAVRLVLGELPDLPHLPELPDRGAGADMVGRTTALLVDLAVDLQPSGWRLVARPGVDGRRASDFLAHDLDALADHAGDYDGPLKLQATGPWTLVASLETTRGGRALADRGAVRDLASSLAEGLAWHVADVRRRVPGAEVVVQLDEPSLPAVLAGGIPSASGYGRLAAVPGPDATEVLQSVVSRVGVPVAVHSCAPSVPVGLSVAAGAQAVSLDASLLTTAQDESLGEAVEAGVALWLGVVPTHEHEMSDLAATVAPVRGLWRRLGFDPGSLASCVVLTPVCGLAGASPAYARGALARVREAGLVLAEDPEGDVTDGPRGRG
ncbi:MAG: methionine synthase [Actinomycetes bacterium]